MKTLAPSAQDLATTRLRATILTNKLMPGDTLPPERELERQLGVSRPTLRGAISALVAEGLLTVTHGSGTHVRSWLSDGIFDLVGHLLVSSEDEEFIRQLLWLRRTLYTSVAELWTRPRPDFVEALGASQAVLEASWHDGTMVARMLDTEERLLCLLAGDVNVPAAMLGHGIRRALRQIVHRSELPPALPKAHERFAALVDAFMEGRKAVRLVAELCSLREAVYLDAALR
jgi:DNA-binding GntR family transcriptional regulator